MFPRKQIKANARAALSANYWPVVGYPLLLGLLLVVIMVVLAIGPILSLGGLPDASSIATTEAALAKNLGTTLLTDTVSILLSVFFINVLAAGELFFYYKFYSGSRGDFGTFFEGFKNGLYLHVVGGMFLMSLFISLWSLIFVLPGTILAVIGFTSLMLTGSGEVMFIIGAILYIAGIVLAFVKAYQYSMIPYLLIDKPEFTVSDCFNMTKKMTKGNKWNLFVLDLSFIGWILLSFLTVFILAIFYVGPYMRLASAGAYDYLKRIHMPEATEGPVFQSASYEADYASVEQPADNTGTLNNTTNDDIFDE
ncbi:MULTISPECIES: DUF975 family protein [Pseudobutyrivibrio]|uniref:DUF975 family protein n=1 Tax=Pseudobutyrivibrio xylanivorans TaxID=185007 RepID=A0A1G5S1P7_PSEXY|nr:MULTISPECIES: DUF975 family protein [Pseudobutyrivibrio]MDC7280052.1 DUF975 family protein [Butyrivibrio fibrisolvens]SCZ80312.1 Protein of unknown function [Pseudobutyrivibrio xylanivorans]